jgi:hypothetical protein
MIDLSSPFALDAARPFEALFLPIVSAMKGYFALDIDSRHRLEVLSAVAESEPLHSPWKGVAMQSAWLAQMASVYGEESPPSIAFITDVPIRVWVLSRLRDIAPSQKRWLEKLMPRLCFEDFFDADFHFANQEEQLESLGDQASMSMPNEDLMMDDAMDSMSAYHLLADGLKEIPPDWGDVWGLAHEAISMIFMNQPRDIAEACKTLANEVKEAWYLTFIDRVKSLASKKWRNWKRAEPKLASEIGIPVDTLRRWLTPNYTSTHKGRCMVAKALGVDVEDLVPVLESGYCTRWANYVRRSLGSNAAGVIDQIDWQQQRAEFFSSNVLNILRQRGIEPEAFVERMRERQLCIGEHLSSQSTEPPRILDALHVVSALELELSEVWLSC